MKFVSYYPATAHAKEFVTPCFEAAKTETLLRLTQLSLPLELTPEAPKTTLVQGYTGFYRALIEQLRCGRAERMGQTFRTPHLCHGDLTHRRIQLPAMGR